ncbi:MAG: hypothetical protein AAF430_18485 [Myxococcota bacterium]
MAAIAAGAASCSWIHLDPVTDEVFTVTPVSDPERTVTFLEPMVWSNAPKHRSTKGVRLLDGTYVLEAEDHEFLYFRSPAVVEMRDLEEGVPVDGRDLVGGLALSKNRFALVSAVAYVSINEHRKKHVMKMGRGFTRLEGRIWEKSF